MRPLTRLLPHLVGVPLLLSCAGDSLFVAPAVGDLSGRWLLKDSSVATVTFVQPPFENICVTDGDPYDLTPLPGDTMWVAEQARGGTFVCQNDDRIYAKGNLPYFRRTYYVVWGEQGVRWFTEAGEVEYRGQVRAPGAMRGTRDTAFNGRRGRWWAQRVAP